LRHDPPRITSATLSKSEPVIPASGSGQSQCVTTPTLSPPAGPFSSQTLASLNQSEATTGGARFALSLKARKNSRWFSTPAFPPSSSVIWLSARATRAASVSALAPRLESVVTSVPAGALRV
jgi:hypothetical protein